MARVGVPFHPPLDVARAVMSCAFDGKRIDVSLVEAFLVGYRSQHPFPSGLMVRSLDLLWYMESPWWIRANMDPSSVAPWRFAEEMMWLAAHREELPSMLGGL